MPRLEELSSGARVRGLAPQGVATVKHVEWQGDACVEVFYLDDRGVPQQAILFRHDEPNLAFETATRPWSFDADGDLLRLVSEAYRIQLAPERRSYTAQYKLTAGEDEPYREVTSCVRAEMNRAERFAGPDQQRPINVGFALMKLQRRLACTNERSIASLRSAWDSEGWEQNGGST